MTYRPIVVITGVSRGLGRHLAEGFAARNYRVAGCARSVALLDDLSKALGPDHLLRAVDISDDMAVASFSEEVLDTMGAPDLLINSAAVIHDPAPLWEVGASEVSNVVGVNIVGTVNLVRHFVPAMILRGRGIIVNFSSGWGRSTSAGVAPYCASKWAIEGLTRALAQDLPPGLAAVSFNPGIIDTDMLRTCFGEEASLYPGPAEWAATAVPYLASLTPAQNGEALTCPGH